MHRTHQQLLRITLLFTVGLGFYCGHEAPEAPPQLAQKSATLTTETTPRRELSLLSDFHAEQQKLLASDRASGDFFGRASALSGDGNTAIVGAWSKAAGTSLQSGAAYVYTRSGTSFSEQQKLSASDTAAGDSFGISVAISSDGNTAIVGAWNKADGMSLGVGAVYVFTRSGTTWSEQQKLTGSDKAGRDSFGNAVALSSDGNTALVGAWNKSKTSGTYEGAAYIFTRSGSMWSEQRKLSLSDAGTNDRFGSSVSLSADGNTAIVGADSRSEFTPSFFIETGAAYVFTRSGTSWTQQQKLQATDMDAYDHFGKSVSLSADGNITLVGAYKKSTGALSSNGAAYVFTRSAGKWTQLAALTASDAATADRYGYSAALSADGNLALIGSYFNSEGGLGKSGAAYLYARSGSSYVEQQKLLSADRAIEEFFGASVALSSKGTTAIIGADSKTDGTFTQCGAAYIFVPAPPKSNGSSCRNAVECKSGFCADGVCCDTACGGGSNNDCQACSKARGAASDGTCGPVAAGAVCRQASGDCDAAEVCDGTGPTCPSDALRPAGQICRNAVGACDSAEVCDGATAACPPDVFKPSATICRAAAGACDVAEVCSGVNSDCPSDGLQAAGAVCRAAAGACDVAEVCNGASAQCPPDSVLAAGTVCRAAAGVCDNAEICTGTSASCPADKFKSSATTCRAAAGVCDSAEKCSGSSAACPADKFKSNTTVCRASAGSCDLAEFCSGSFAACPADQFKPLLVLCRPTVGPCDLADYCTGGSPACPPDDFLPAGTICRPAMNSCDVDEMCSGSNAVCPVDRTKPDGTACTGGTCKAGMCI